MRLVDMDALLEEVDGITNEWLIARDVLRPVEPTKIQNDNRIDYFCGNCTTKVGMLFSKEEAWRFHYNFCPYCGRKVKWND